MADLSAGLIGALVFVVLLVGGRQPVLVSAALASGAYLGVRLLLTPKRPPVVQPWLEPLAQRWAGRDEGERLESVLRIGRELRTYPSLTSAVEEHLSYLERACLPYRPPGTFPTGQARTELLTLIELIEKRLLRLGAALTLENDRALASELAALRQTLVELVPERRLENMQR